MGGRGSGGRRTGSGRKLKTGLEHAIDGTRGTVLQHPSAPAVAPIITFEPPQTMRGRALGVWRELAPSAFEARTLTPATTVAFVMLCRAVAQERLLGASKRYANGPNHRGLMQRVGSWLKDFGLAPLGKPLYAAEAPVANPLDRFIKRTGA